MTLPTIPDSLYKFFVILGASLIVYAFISRQNELKTFNSKRIEYECELKRLTYEQNYFKDDLKSIYQKAHIYSRRYHVENPLVVTDTSYSFNRVIIGNKNDVIISDTINNFIEQFELKNKEFENKSNELDIKNFQLENLSSQFDEVDNFSIALAIIGIILFMSGISIWYKKDNISEDVLRNQIFEKNKIHSHCQSCSKEFNSMTLRGKELDGSINFSFCSLCYTNGQFTEEDLNLKEFQEKIKLELKNKGIANFRIKIILAQLQNLERWNKDNYL